MEVWLLPFGGFQQLCHKVAFRTQVHAAPMSRVLCIEQGEAIVVFLQIFGSEVATYISPYR